jgi:hypothetical protein
MAETPTQTAFELDTEEESSDLELSKLPRSDLKTNPTQPALEVEEVVDGHYGSAMSNLALETPRYCLVAFAGTRDATKFPSTSYLQSLLLKHVSAAPVG